MKEKSPTPIVKESKTAGIRYILWISIVLSLVLTCAVVASMSFVFTGSVVPEYMAAGAVTALLVSSAVAFIVIFLARRINEDRYLSMLEDLPELICRWMPDGMITYVNESCSRYFGKTKKELVGQSIAQFIPEKERKRIEKHLYALLKEDPVVTVEHRVTLQGRDTRWHRSTVSSVFGEQGDLKVFQSVGMDITERKLAEQSLKKSEERYRNLVNEISDGFAVSDHRGKITLANKALAGILGFETPRELLGKNLTEFFHPTTRTRELAEFKKAFETGRLPEVVVSKVIRKDGGTAFVEVRPVPVIEQGSLVGSMGVIRDVTERITMEDEIKHRLDEVERLNKLMVGRELKMEGLRKEIVRLREKLRES
jgi:PAS domain S-box-containing protein